VITAARSFERFISHCPPAFTSSPLGVDTHNLSFSSQRNRSGSLHNDEVEAARRS
jgi:hypothetical protein